MRATGYHTPPVGLDRIVAGNEWVGVSTTVLGHAPLLNPEKCCDWCEMFRVSATVSPVGRGINERLDGVLPVCGEG